MTAVRTIVIVGIGDSSSRRKIMIKERAIRRGQRVIVTDESNSHLEDADATILDFRSEPDGTVYEVTLLRSKDNERLVLGYLRGEKIWKVLQEDLAGNSTFVRTGPNYKLHI